METQDKNLPLSPTHPQPRVILSTKLGSERVSSGQTATEDLPACLSLDVEVGRPEFKSYLLAGELGQITLPSSASVSSLIK